MNTGGQRHEHQQAAPPTPGPRAATVLCANEGNSTCIEKRTSTEGQKPEHQQAAPSMPGPHAATVWHSTVTMTATAPATENASENATAAVCTPLSLQLPLPLKLPLKMSLQLSGTLGPHAATALCTNEGPQCLKNTILLEAIEESLYGLQHIYPHTLTQSRREKDACSG
eukprot:scaffold47161_cov15-Tisochrysis_lutea.AAC.1